MDPVTIGAVLLAIVSGAAGEVGSKLWDGLSALVRRPFHRRQAAGAAAISSGEVELAALQQAPSDERRAMALAAALVARAGTDEDFQQGLENWWARASQVHTGQGNVTNTISGGTQHGPVFQGRDFSGVTLNSPPPQSSQ